MPTRSSPKAVAFPILAARRNSGQVQSGQAAGAAYRARTRATASVVMMPAGGSWRSRWLDRLAAALADIAGALAVVYALPLVILGIGIPMALLLRLGLWIVGAL